MLRQTKYPIDYFIETHELPQVDRRRDPGGHIPFIPSTALIAFAVRHEVTGELMSPEIEEELNTVLRTSDLLHRGVFLTAKSLIIMQRTQDVREPSSPRNTSIRVTTYVEITVPIANSK